MPITISYLWDFGDGTTSTERNPRHTYKMPGVYLVTLTAEDNYGNSGTDSLYIYVYDWDYLGGINVSKTDRCLRHAIPQLPGQGIGWALYDDVNEEVRNYNWPFPEGIVGTCQIIDSNDRKRQIVIDSNTFRHFELGVDDSWIDGQGDYAGTEIESEVTFREHPAPIGASAKIKHSESHLNIKPWFKDRRGAAGYTADGFRETFEADLYVRVGSSDEDAAITKQVPYRGQLVYDRNIISDFIQEGVKIRGAPWRLVSTEMWFKQIDTAASPTRKRMSEQAWADQFREPLTWFPRTTNIFLNSATNIQETGTNTGLTTGPDSYPNSAVVMGIVDSLTTTPSAVTGNFTLYFWLRNPATGIVVYSQGTLTVTLNLVGDDWQLVWNDGTNNITFTLSEDFSDWSQIAITREDNVLRVYENYQLINTAILDSVLTHSGTATLFAGACTWHDFRLIPRVTTQSAIEYIYRDVIENQGNSTSPVY